MFYSELNSSRTSLNSGLKLSEDRTLGTAVQSFGESRLFDHLKHPFQFLHSALDSVENGP